MKRNHFVVLAVALACLIAGLLFLLLRGGRKEKTDGMEAATSASPSPAFNMPGLAATPQRSVATISPRPKSKNEARAEAVKMVQGIFNTPISFYGKVQDQFGKPVEGAQVKYSAIDKFWENGSHYEGVSDASGYFSITGIKGAGLTVGVMKDGYDNIDGKSDGSFGYGMGVDKTRQKPPTQDSPAIFILRKKAKAEPLIAISTNFRVPKNGSPVEISLKTGMGVAPGQGDLKIECWTSDQSKNAQGHYEWHCRFSTPGGGLVERGDQLDQEAPVDGYKPFVEFEMAQNTQPWRPSAGGEYFLKIGNGSYARARLQMIAGGDHFATVESYLNPKPGSRNLEYDPSKQAPAQ